MHLFRPGSQANLCTFLHQPLDVAKLKESKKAARIRIAAVPTAMKRQTHHTNFYRELEGKLDMKVIQRKLTPENYKEKFHHLLCWEEKEHERLLAER